MIRTVGIVGGGISGTLIVLNLLKQARKPMHLVWFDKDNHFCKGLAYSTLNNAHLLNIRAGNMSAFPDEPNHFVNWLEANKTGYTTSHFVPRKLYGSYITDTYNSLKASTSTVRITQKAEEVVAFHVSDDKYLIVAKEAHEVNTLILAPGNFLPAHPASATGEFKNSKNYFRNAFEPVLTERALAATSLTLIGAGLTMVDVVVALEAAHYKGKITIISPHGYLPMPHDEGSLAVPVPFLNAGTGYTLSEVFRLVKNRLKEAIKNQEQPQLVIDSMRPYLQDLWFNFSFEEKKRFLRHLRHKWGVARHRAPISGIKIMKKLMDEQRLNVLKGRIYSIEEMPEGFAISYATAAQPKNTFISEMLINCTGPEPDFTKVESLLVKQLINNGLITPHELGYGLKAPKNGQLGKGIYTLGPPLKGVLWESTAVPEIRLQAKEIASEIILD